MIAAVITATPETRAPSNRLALAATKSQPLRLELERNGLGEILLAAYLPRGEFHIVFAKAEPSRCSLIDGSRSVLLRMNRTYFDLDHKHVEAVQRFLRQAQEVL